MSFLQPKPAENSSSNLNNNLITSTYAPTMGAGTGATNFLAQLLGVTPGAVSSGANTVGNAANNIATAGGANAGYQNYLQMAGYQPAMTALSRNITGQGAASGLLNSGSTATALQTQGAGLNNQFYNNYLQQLSGLAGLGLQGGGLVANAGQVSKGTGGSPSTVGSIASTIGGLASIFSDRRLKRNIELVDREPDGLGVYLCRYVWSRTRRLMVMADEVAKLRPWALGRTRFGYSTVVYGAL